MAISTVSIFGLISLGSSRLSYETFASASKTFIWPGILPATGCIPKETSQPFSSSKSPSSLTTCCAQHVVKELGDLLEENGCEVSFGIHPVAGRMPGHMNVLLAEANVSYDNLLEPKDINPKMDTVDIAIVIGANDVVNPSATEEPGSPIYGMPILEVHRAKTVMVLKRSMASGFAGVQNPLFFKENSRMLFGDAKESISKLVAEFKD